MKKSKFTVLLILLVGILTFISCSSGGGSPNTNSGGGDEIISCLWENDYGSEGKGKMCAKIYGYSGNRKCSSDGGGGKSVESCPSNPDKTCLMIGTIEGKEYDMDVFLYGYSSSFSCEEWASGMGIPSRLR